MLARLPKPSAAHRGWNKGDDTKGFVAEDPRPRVHPERRPEHEILSDRRAQHPPRRAIRDHNVESALGCCRRRPAIASNPPPRMRASSAISAMVLVSPPVWGR